MSVSDLVSIFAVLFVSGICYALGRMHGFDEGLKQQLKNEEKEEHGETRTDLS